jgi:hypothetical protein
MALYQFQCQKEGSIFYYQHGATRPPTHVVGHCPVCGSKRVEPTGRVYPDVDEGKPIRKRK